MAATIKIKNSSTASAVPTSSDLVQGELAVNVTDKRVFTENASGTVVELGTNPSTLTVAAGASIQGLTVGRGAGSVSTNTAVGASALANNTTGSQGVFIGAGAGSANTTGINNVGVGFRSLYSGTTTGSQNVGVGSYALYGVTTGANNSGFGQETLQSNTTGSANVAVGTNALNSNTTASNNTAVGYQAGYNSNAAYNIFLGYQSGFGSGATHTAERNTAIGVFSGYSLTSGSNNTFVGSLSAGGGSAGDSITTGSKNTIIGNYGGNQGGLDIRTSSNYIVLSDGDGNPRGIFDDEGTFYVGGITPSADGTVGIASKTTNANAQNLTLWNTATSGTRYFGYFGVGSTFTNVGAITSNGSSTSYVTSSDYRLKENVQPMTGALATVALLKPCTYTWKADGSAGQGFIAHELQEVVPDAVNGEKDAVNEDGSIKPQGIDTSFLVATLTAAIQELNAQQAALKAEFDAYKEAHP